MKIKPKNNITIILYCILCVVSFCQLSMAQETSTVSGYIKDLKTGEELIGATIFIAELQTGTTTNVNGYYSMTVQPGKYQLKVSYVGYETHLTEIHLSHTVELNVQLSPATIHIQEVVINAERDDANLMTDQMSTSKIDVAQIRKLPALLGEVDIIKIIQMQPGVISAGEGTSSYFVRGGSADQNLILLDEAPIYDPSHFFGLFSVFNADAIKESQLYRGGIPSKFGGRLSSILEVKTKDGNNKELAGSGGIGLLASRLTIEGPITKDKSSYIISGRRSYADALLRLAQEETSVLFYDVNAKINWKPNNKNRFFASLYNGRDLLRFDKNLGFEWGNATASIRLNHLFNNQLFSNTTLIGSSFDYKLEFKDPFQGFVWKSKIKQVSLHNDLTYYINPNNALSFGYHLTYKHFQPGKISPNAENSIFEQVEMEDQFALEHALYLENHQSIGEKLSITYGARLSIMQNIGESDVFLYSDPSNNVDVVRTDTLHFGAFENIKTYVNLEPRASFRFIITNVSSIKGSYNRMVQNTHLISNGTVPVPFNTWLPSGYYLKPQIADQWALGYFHNFHDNTFSLAIEAFYKELQNVTEFADNANVFFNQDLSVEFRQGESKSYGVELLVEKRVGKLTGFASYTLSKATRLVAGVNQGMEFAANYDRRNVLNITAVYNLNSKWNFGVNFTYSSGRPITLPSGRYSLEGIYNPDLITERNAYHLPAVHRMDISATLNPARNKGKKFQGQWVFSVYNVYNRKNPFSIYTRSAQDKDGNIIGDGSIKEARLLYLFSLLPSVTYNFKF